MSTTQQFYISFHNISCPTALDDIKRALQQVYSDKDILVTSSELEEFVLKTKKVIQILPKFDAYETLCKESLEKDKLIKELEYNNTKALSSIQSFHVTTDFFKIWR